MRCLACQNLADEVEHKACSIRSSLQIIGNDLNRPEFFIIICCRANESTAAPWTAVQNFDFGTCNVANNDWIECSFLFAGNLHEIAQASGISESLHVSIIIVPCCCEILVGITDNRISSVRVTMDCNTLLLPPTCAGFFIEAIHH